MNIGIVRRPTKAREWPVSMVSPDTWRELVKCAERGGSNEAELIKKLEAGHSMIWPVEGGCLVIDRTEDGAALFWLGVGRGSLRHLLAVESPVADMARDEGCTRLRIEGRRGWARVLRHWKVVKREGDNVVMELEI